MLQHTLETALLSASQELSEQDGSSAAAMQSLIQQRDVLQNGLLSTCRELSRVSTVSPPSEPPSLLTHQKQGGQRVHQHPSKGCVGFGGGGCSHRASAQQGCPTQSCSYVLWDVLNVDSTINS